MKVNIEITDTFGGEANYAWVRRYAVEVPTALSKHALMRRIKRIIGWSGCRCHTTDFGDMIEIRPYGAYVVAFATVGESE